MSRTRVTLITLACVLRVWFSRISGAEEVSIRVRPGDDVTIYSDCVWKKEFKPVWFRNCSHHQPPLMILKRTETNQPSKNLMYASLSRYTFVRNNGIKTTDLLIENVSESDLGLYYCAVHKKSVTKNASRQGVQKVRYIYGKITTRLSFLETTSTPSCMSWKLLVSMCLVCVLLSSLLSSTCVIFICRTRNKGSKKQMKTNGHRKQNRKSTKSDKFRQEEDDVCYASLDLPKRGQKRQKKKRFEGSDFSSYSEVKIDRMGALSGPAD